MIGGGPAGTSASRVLAASGIETVLVEKDLAFKKPCGGGMPLSAFGPLGIPASLAARTVREFRLVAPSGHTAVTKLPEADVVAIVERGTFDAALRGIAEAAGARVVEAQFMRFADKGRTTVAELLSPGGEAFSIEADHVIATDGVNSRAAIGIGRADAVYTMNIKTAALPAGRSDACEFWFGMGHAPGFYSWVFPARDGVSLGTGCAEGRELRGRMAAFLRRLGAADDPMEGARVYRIPRWRSGAVPLRHGGILFAGDAAGHVMPLTFEGIYYAMRSGALAANCVAGGRPEKYERQWKAEFGMTFGLMRMLRGWFLRSDDRMEKFVRLFERPEVMSFALGIWTDKRLLNGRGLRWYANILRKI